MEMKYKLITWNTSQRLSDEVNKYFREGWELYGFPFSNGNGYSQALIKSEKEDENEKV